MPTVNGKYDVQFGQWCQKLNGHRYWTGTKEDLLLAKQAGQIEGGVEIIVHERTTPVGTVIMNVADNVPGYIKCDGQVIDPLLTDLIALVGPKAPDWRECAPVMPGQNPLFTNHDVFTVGEVKDQVTVVHDHNVTLTDPGHAHDVTDPGHDHNVTLTDPGHAHDVTDPGHSHVIDSAETGLTITGNGTVWTSEHEITLSNGKHFHMYSAPTIADSTSVGEMRQDWYGRLEGGGSGVAPYVSSWSKRGGPSGDTVINDGIYGPIVVQSADIENKGNAYGSMPGPSNYVAYELQLAFIGHRTTDQERDNYSEYKCERYTWASVTYRPNENHATEYAEVKLNDGKHKHSIDLSDLDLSDPTHAHTAQASSTGISVNSGTTGITLSEDTVETGVSVDTNSTGITLTEDTFGDGTINRGKRFGINFFIKY